MLLSTSRQVRQIVVGLVIIAAILMIVVIPFMSFDMVNPLSKPSKSASKNLPPKVTHRLRFWHTPSGW
jgi:branched-subunit amino acid transport protein AzlD